MKFGKSMLIALAILLNASITAADEVVWPEHSASELSAMVAFMKFRVHADHCSAELPQLKPEFESRMNDLDRRTQAFSNGLLATEEFRGMKDKPVPAGIIDAFKDIAHDLEHNLERRDAASTCPKSLQDLGEMDDESLKSGLTGAFKAVQTMIRNMEEDGAG